jgi:tRNA 2-thiouridine synthesizing protein E
VTEAAQHARLKKQQDWIFCADPATEAANQWSESMAQQLAVKWGIQLSEAHWEVIRFVRHYHLERGFVRRSRELSSALNARFREQGGKKYLYRLFHGGPVLKACRLGGIPLPENCVDASFGTAF